MIRISGKVRADFRLYAWCYDVLGDGGRFNPFGDASVVPSTEGRSAIECFALRDSRGIKEPCCESQLLQKALCGKSLLNLHIAMWAEGVAEGVTFIWELAEAFPSMPDWAWLAVRRQAHRIGVGR